MKILKKNCQVSKCFIVPWLAKKIVIMNMSMFLRFGTNFQWKRWKIIKTLYLKFDVLLIVDAFEKLKNCILKNYWLCSSHYLSPPTLNWDAKLKMIKVELELTSDADMHFFFEKCIRGGVSYISKRFNKANHKHLISYDPKQE